MEYCRGVERVVVKGVKASPGKFESFQKKAEIFKKGYEDVYIGNHTYAGSRQVIKDSFVFGLFFKKGVFWIGFPFCKKPNRCRNYFRGFYWDCQI